MHAAIAELLRRKGKTVDTAVEARIATEARLRAYLFDKQTEFIEHPAKLKAALCTRRAGKSEAMAVSHLLTSTSGPYRNSVYVAKTRETAKAIFWPKLHAIHRAIPGLELDFHETALTCTSSNGSVIKVTGADQNKREIEKMLGQDYHRATIDECASFRLHIRELVYDVLLPAVGENNGEINMLGTPGDALAGFFYDVTAGLEKQHEWKTFSWSWKDNPHVRDAIQKQVDEMLAFNPLVRETPSFRRNYLGEWVLEADNLVYKFDHARNTYDRLPALRDPLSVLAVDLGYEDDSAFVLATFDPSSPNLYVVEAFKIKHMDLHDVAEIIKGLQANYAITYVVVDAAAKQGVETIKNRFGIPLIAAEKVDKIDAIETLNSDFIQGYIKVPITAEELIGELRTLVWLKDAAKRTEDPRCDNHLADALLYCWRKCRHYFFAPVVSPPEKGTPEYIRAEEAGMLARAETRFLGNQNTPWWEQ